MLSCDKIVTVQGEAFSYPAVPKQEASGVCPDTRTGSCREGRVSGFEIMPVHNRCPGGGGAGKDRAYMKQVVGIGYQDFEKIREKNCFYVDKSKFIKEWWEGKDEVTLITRPRRFGKTLNMSMVEKFFSVRYAGREDLFQGLKVWEDEKFQRL